MLKAAAIPLAILLGCWMIAVAVYLGLTHRPPEVNAPVPVAAPPPPPPEPLAVVLPRVQSEVQQDLEARRPVMASTCLGDAGVVPLTLSLSFDAQGREIMRGISLVGTGRDDAARCLREKFPPELRIAPPRMNISVEVPFQLR